MANRNRQLTIKGTFRRKVARLEPDEECEELEREIKELQQQLTEKQAELLQLEKDTTKIMHVQRPIKLKTAEEPEHVEFETHRRLLEEQCWRQRLVLGLDVAEYKDDRFTIVYCTQHDAPRPIEYGLRIQIDDGAPAIQRYALPIGFNLTAAVGHFDSIKQRDALCAVWSALVAFHARQAHYELLTKSLPYEVRTLRVLDTSHVELRLPVYRLDEPDRVVDLELDLDYEASADVCATNIDIVADLPDEELDELIRQCHVFRKMPMHEAFGACFMLERGPWQCYTPREEPEPEPSFRAESPPRRPRRKKEAEYHSDNDSWLPEDLRPRKRTKRLPSFTDAFNESFR